MKKPFSRVYLEINNICNRNCSFCHGTKREGKMMSEEELVSALCELDGLTDYLYFHLMGEPLLHPELPRFIGLATERGFKVALTTNGTLLKEREKELLFSGIYKINISLHSFEKGSEAETEDYFESVTSFAKHSSEAGILTVLRLWNKGYDEGRNDLILSLLKSRVRGEWKEGARGIRVRDKLHLEYGDRFAWPDSDVESLGERVFCYGMRDHFGILADGTVVPCCLDSEGAVNLGNIFKTPLKEILASPRVEKIRVGFENKRATEELCKRCGYARRFKL